MIPDRETINPLRRGLLALSALGVVGMMVELATLRHWDNPAELVPWAALVAAGIMVLVVARWPTPLGVRLAVLTGVLLALAGVYGLVSHILANMSTAPLDADVGPIWDGLGLWGRLWLASTGGVGPAPPLSAAALTPTGLALALAGYGHPASRGASERPVSSAADRLSGRADPGRPGPGTRDDV